MFFGAINSPDDQVGMVFDSAESLPEIIKISSHLISELHRRMESGHKGAKMKIYNCRQGSEEWEQIRKGRATASRFKDIVTPAKLQMSRSAKPYACELVAELLGIESPQRPPTFDMEVGTEREPYACEEYANTNKAEIKEVGFCTPDHTDRYGMSPDRIVNCDGLLETKCPKVETLISYHANGVLPPEYFCQVQGQLWISNFEWCDFYAWHPDLEPFQIRVLPEPVFAEAMEKAMNDFLALVDSIYAMVKKREPFGIDFSGVTYG